MGSHNLGHKQRTRVIASRLKILLNAGTENLKKIGNNCRPKESKVLTYLVLSIVCKGSSLRTLWDFLRVSRYLRTIYFSLSRLQRNTTKTEVYLTSYFLVI